MSRDPQEDDELKLCSHTMTLPTRGQLEGRMIVTAYENGLDNVTEEAVTIVIHALEASFTAVCFLAFHLECYGFVIYSQVFVLP